MGIAEFLDAPDGAVLVAINGEVELVTTHHESATKLTIERFPLGPVVAPAAVMALLGAQGFATAQRAPEPVLAAPRAAARQPALVAPAPAGVHICPECGKTFRQPGGLGSHRAKLHGVKGQGPYQRKGPPGASAAVAASVTPLAPEPPTPVPLDVAPLSESPVASEPAISKDRKVKGTPVADGVCPVCHEPLVTHEQCDGCGVLIGAAHVTERGVFIGGATYCRDCAETRMARRRAEREAA